MFHAIRLSKSDPTPLYIQLASELANLIQDNILKEGFKLPTIRLLSRQLSINRDTVVSAYKLLEQQGLVESHIGKGTYIASRQLCAAENCSFLSTPNTEQLCCSQLKLPASFFPPALCEELTKAIIAKESWEAFNDPLLRHRFLLKQSIASFLEHLGVKNHFSQIKFTSCLTEFLLSLYKFFPKTGICVENLRDLTLSCELRSFGAKIYEIPLTSTGMDLDILEKYLRTGTISYIIVSPYLQNPTGLCYSPENKKALLKLAEDYDCYIIEDGSLCEYLLPSLHYVPLFNLSESGRVIYMYQFSRFYLPAMKYTFFVLPTIFNAHISDDHLSSFNERFLHYYLDSEAFLDLKSTICHITANHYHQFLNNLNTSKSPLALTYTNGGIFFWLKLKTADKEDFYNYLTEHQLIVAPGELFATTPLKENYIRLSIGELTTPDVANVLNILLDY